MILFDYVGVEDDLELLGIAPTLPANYRVDRRSASNLAMYKLGSGLVQEWFPLFCCFSLLSRVC